MRINKLLAISLSLALLFSTSAFAASSDDIEEIDSVTVSVTNDISAGTKGASSKDLVSVETDDDEYKVVNVKVTNPPKKDSEWKKSDKPILKFKLRAVGSKRRFTSGFSSNNINVTDIDYTSLQAETKNSNREVDVTMTLKSLSDYNSDDNSGDYDLSLRSVYIEKSTGSVTWDLEGDADNFEVRLLKGSKTIKTISTDNEVYDFGQEIRANGNGKYSVMIRAKHGNYSSSWYKSNVIDLDTSAIETMRQNMEIAKSTGPSTGVSANNYKSTLNAADGTWKLDNGSWKFTMSNGIQMLNGWEYIKNPYATNGEGADWFYFENGLMKTGWLNENGQWFFLSNVSNGTLGHMVTGWQQIDGVYYYFEPDSNGSRGALYMNRTTPDGYTVNESGACVK